MAACSRIGMNGCSGCGCGRRAHPQHAELLLLVKPDILSSCIGEHDDDSARPVHW